MDDNYQSTQAEELHACLTLIRAPGLGGRTLLPLFEKYRSASAIISAAAAGELEAKFVQRLALVRPEQIERDLAWLDQPDRHLLTVHDPLFPEALRQIEDTPVALFVHGDPDWLARPQLAIVGSRNPTPGGRANARDFAHYLSETGITITSGLASGVDGAAHRGALAAQAKTVAVTACGLDLTYPPEHSDLAAQIAAEGALISEFPPSTQPRRGHFPRRNRIISGLSLGTLVVEAARDSGSLITARTAVEQSRELFAIPGSIHNPLTKGCHQLIRQGAVLVENAVDILEQLGPLLSTSRMAPPPLEEAEEQLRWDDDYRRLLEVLELDPQPNDLLIMRSGLTADAVSSMLLLLELEGYVSSAPGKGYCLTRKYAPNAAD